MLEKFNRLLRGRSFNLHERNSVTWDKRAEEAAKLSTKILIDNTCSVADLGCGDRRLERILKNYVPSFEYHGYDVLPIAQGVEKIDLSKDVPRRRHKVAFALGITEYLDDPLSFLIRVPQYTEYLVISYVDHDSGRYGPDKVKERGWKHNMKTGEVERMFDAARLKIDGFTSDGGKNNIWLLST